MEYRNLGRTGLKVSIVSFGNWLNSNSAEDKQRTIDLVKTAWDHGINFFDTAQLYGFGQAQKQMGVAIKALNVPRNQIVVSTKILKNDPECKPNRIGLSRKHIIQGLKTSLKNLELDHVDIVYAHRPFYNVPMEEIVRAFDWVVRKGLAHYWGTSEWDAADIAEANAVSQRLNLISPVVEQPQYNILHRERFQIQYDRLFRTTGMGATVWSPLAGGLLTGRYNEGVPAGSRYQKFEFTTKVMLDNLFGQKNKEQSLKKFEGFATIAKQLGGSQAQLAMAWVLYNKNVSTAITGASTPSQLSDTVKSVQILKKFTPQIQRRIQQIFKTAPTGKFDLRILSVKKSPRLLAFESR